MLLSQHQHQSSQCACVLPQGRVLMLNDRIRNVTDLERSLINAERKLKPYQDDVRAFPLCCHYPRARVRASFNCLTETVEGTPAARSKLLQACMRLVYTQSNPDPDADHDSDPNH